MGALSTFVNQEIEAKSRRSCKLCAVLDQLDDEDRESITEVIANRALSFDRVSALLKKANYEVSPTTITRHFNNCEYILPS